MRLWLPLGLDPSMVELIGSLLVVIRTEALGLLDGAGVQGLELSALLGLLPRVINQDLGERELFVLHLGVNQLVFSLQVAVLLELGRLLHNGELLAGQADDLLLAFLTLYHRTVRELNGYGFCGGDHAHVEL